MSPSLCSPLCIPLQSPLDFYPVHLELYPVPVSIGSFNRDLTIGIQSHKPIPNFFWHIGDLLLCSFVLAPKWQPSKIQQEMASSLEDLKKFDLLSNKFESFLEMMKQISGQVERDGSLADDGRRVIWRFASTDNHRGGASRFGDGAYPASGAPPTAAPATTASSASL